MKIILMMLAISLMSPLCWARHKAFDIKMDFSINGEHIASPRINVLAGEKATITEELDNGKKSFIEVLATEQQNANGSSGSIQLQFEVGNLNKDGSKTILYRPKIVSIPDQESTITVHNSKDKETLSLSVIANEKPLNNATL